MKKLKILLLFIVLISIKSAFSQQNRIYNNDTIFYFGSKWNTKIDNQLIPFDSTLVIVKFNEESNQDFIINYLQSHQIELIDSFYNYKLCRLATGISLSRSLDSLSSSDYFEFIDLNKSCIPNTVDSLNRYQIHINPIGVGVGPETVLNVTNTHNNDSAWHYTSGNPKIIVAVIDAYPDWSHVDIGKGTDSIENVWKNPGEDPWTDPNDPTTGDSVDNDGNGLIDDWKGWDFHNNTNDVRPRTIYDTHGTKVAGVIAAKRNNSKGVAGIAGGNYLSNTESEGVRLMTINVFSSKINAEANVYGTYWALAEAIEYAAMHHAKIIALSTSTGSSKEVPIIHDALIRAKELYNCTIFCSAGNGVGVNRYIQFPASDENVYSIGAINVAGDSNKYCIGDTANNYKLDFVALGEKIVTTSTNNSYVFNFEQTSAASPQASGVAALLYSFIPCANDQIIYEAMKLTASKYVGQNTYDFDNYTYSITHGYGFPDATAAILLLKSYKLNNHHITTNTTWTSPKIATTDINITSGNTLTIKSTLIMVENTKIIVEAGGNLVIDSGTVTSTCGWKGIEVYGISTESQNSNTFGEVIVKKGGKIEGAWIGIHSIYGGIVKTSSNAVFRNNDQSIFIDKYVYDHDSSSIIFTNFISDGPFLPASNYETGKFYGVHNFIRLIDARYLTIDTCKFENTYGLHFYEQAIAIYAIGVHKLEIKRSDFSGMYKACEIIGHGGFKNQVFVTNCNFTNVLQGIRFANLDIYVYNNTFELAYVNTKLFQLNDLYHSFGVYSHGCINSISGNIFNSKNTKSCGLVIRNSRTLYNSKIAFNSFTNLKYGTQVEQYNKKLIISCNQYTNNTGNAWSVNPFFAGNNLFPMQGSDLPGTGHKRAGNLFYDRGLSASSLRHIRSSMDFIYNAANDPIYAVPEFKSSILTVREFEEPNSESCSGNGGFFIPCGETNCSTSQLIYLLSITENVDSIDIYRKAIIYEFVLNKQYDDALDKIDEWNDTPEMNEYLFECNFNLKKYTQAETILNVIDTSLDRNLDYFHFYSIVINQYKNNLERDSLTSAQLAIMEDIASRTNDVSDLAMSYLNFFKNSAYLMNPEEWEEESSRPINNAANPSLDSLTNKKTSIFSFSIFPNPTSSETSIFINSENENNKFKIEIYNSIGNKQLENINISSNGKFKLNTSRLASGVYTIKLSDENNAVISKRLVILH